MMGVVEMMNDDLNMQKDEKREASKVRQQVADGRRQTENGKQKVLAYFSHLPFAFCFFTFHVSRLTFTMIASLLILTPALHAQNLIVANPAEFTDFRSVFVNPAALAFQRPHAAIGGKMYHLGFVDGQANPFRHGYISLSLPSGVDDEMGLGLQSQYFNSPLYSQSNISFVLSRRFKHIYSFGLRFNIFSRSYNQDNFDLVDPDDPVFRNGTTKWAGTFGAGVSMFPLPFLSLGIGIDHVNKANISLTNDSVYQPLAVYGGATVNMGMFYASVSAFHEDGRWLPRTSVGTQVPRQGYATIGYDQNSLQAEAQWRISGPLSLNYNYEYTLFENDGTGVGSHSITLIHDFNRKRELPKFEIPDEFRAEFKPPDKSMDEEAKFYVYSIVDKLEITEKKLRRVIAPDVTREQLAALTLFELGVLDSSNNEKVSVYQEDPVDLGLIPATLDASLSDDYQEFLQEVSGEMNEKEVHTRIITPKGSYLRAAGLRKFFRLDSLSAQNIEFIEPVYQSRTDSLAANQKLGDSRVVPFESLTSLSTQSTTFQITPISNTLAVKDWRLVLRDANQREIKSFSGTDMPLSELRWDWLDTFGNLVAPGIYSYELEWRDARNNRNITPAKYLSVQKLIRNITIEVTKKQKETGAEADEIEIILKE